MDNSERIHRGGVAMPGHNFWPRKEQPFVLTPSADQYIRRRVSELLAENWTEQQIVQQLEACTTRQHVQAVYAEINNR
jgi:hypothetical protein